MIERPGKTGGNIWAVGVLAVIILAGSLCVKFLEQFDDTKMKPLNELRQEE